MKKPPLDLEKMRDVFLREDPMGIYFQDLNNFDEYDPEIKLLLPEIDSCQSQEILYDTIRRIFLGKFGNVPTYCEEKLHHISRILFELNAH